MKNKTKTYVLLILVLAIWGVIGYRIFSAVNPSTPEISQQHLDISFRPQTYHKVDTFSISTVNRDPFLGTLIVEKKKIPKKTRGKTIEWKPINYHGTISKKDANPNIFIVSIDGKQYLMKKGQVFNDVKLVKGNSNQITVSFQGIRKTIERT